LGRIAFLVVAGLIAEYAFHDQLGWINLFGEDPTSREMQVTLVDRYGLADHRQVQHGGFGVNDRHARQSAPPAGAVLRFGRAPAIVTVYRTRKIERYWSAG